MINKIKEAVIKLMMSKKRKGHELRYNHKNEDFISKIKKS
jgi:hypothetical protein